MEDCFKFLWLFQNVRTLNTWGQRLWCRFLAQLLKNPSSFLKFILFQYYIPRVYGKTADNFWDTFSKVYRTFTVSFIVLLVIVLFRLTFWWAFFRRGSVIIWRHTTYLNLAWHLQALRNMWGRLGFIPTIF